MKLNAAEFVLLASLLFTELKAADEDVYADIDANTDYYEDDNEVDIKLLSKPEVFGQSLNSSVVLPCQASSTDYVIRVWIKDTYHVFQGNINLLNKKNLRLLSNGSLEVTIQSEEDYGKYSCKLVVSASNQPEIVHEIMKQASPTITALYANDNKSTVIFAGELLTLTCEATGYPKPIISWHKNNERLGTEGEIMTIRSVRPKHAGSYRCLADNRIGKPAHKHIEIYVTHAPIVTVEKYMVNSDYESDVELICDVKAYPAPVVNWQKDGQNLINKEPKVKLTKEINNERNILVIKDIKEDDFGQYLCVATNVMGRQTRSVSLVRTPAIRSFEKSLTETTKDIILQWMVESKQPISMHELQYRKKGEQSWKTVTPEVTEGDNDVYLIQHTLKNLESWVYETRARSKNSNGWSDFSDIMPFVGDQLCEIIREEIVGVIPLLDPTHDTPAQHRSEEISPIGESKPGSAAALHSSIFLVSLSLFKTYFHIRH